MEKGMEFCEFIALANFFEDRLHDPRAESRIGFGLQAKDTPQASDITNSPFALVYVVLINTINLRFFSP
jgi:hypothetical protein